MAGTLAKLYAHAVALTTAYDPILQIRAPADLALVMKSIRLSFSDLTLAPHAIKITRGETTPGTGTVVTPVAIDEDHDHTLQATGRKTFTVDPSGSPVDIEEFYLGPGGILELLEKDTRVAPGDQLTVWVNGSAATGNCSVTMEYEE